MFRFSASTPPKPAAPKNTFDNFHNTKKEPMTNKKEPRMNLFNQAKQQNTISDPEKDPVSIKPSHAVKKNPSKAAPSHHMEQQKKESPKVTVITRVRQ